MVAQDAKTLQMSRNSSAKAPGILKGLIAYLEGIQVVGGRKAMFARADT